LGLRNGNWARLSALDKAFYRCALWVARARGCIRNMRLLVEVAKVVMRLLASREAYVMRVGYHRAQVLMKHLTENDVTKWAPQVSEWFKHRSFILYLGALELNG